MTLKNPYGLTLNLDEPAEGEDAGAGAGAGFDAVALRAFTVDHELPELPELDDHLSASTTAAATAASNVRMRIRDSAVLRSEHAAGFDMGDGDGGDNAPTEEVEEEEEDGEADYQDAVKLNFFVHNGYRYDGRLFKLRGPQERSLQSRPGRVLAHTPAQLNLKQDFQRVYSEATYNTRPSSLRELRLSARLSATSWASVSEMLAAADAPPTPTPGTSGVQAAPAPARSRVSLLVQSELVSEEQASRIKVASPNDPPAPGRAPRAVKHIGPDKSQASNEAHKAVTERRQSGTERRQSSSERRLRLGHGQVSNENAPPPRRKKKPSSGSGKPRAVGSIGEERERERKIRARAPNAKPQPRSALAPSNYTPLPSVEDADRDGEVAAGKMRPRRPARSPAPKKKTFWQSLGLK